MCSSDLASRRGFWGASRPSEPSRFLADIPEHLLAKTSGGSATMGGYAPSWMSNASPMRRPTERPLSSFDAPAVRPAARPAPRVRELDELDDDDDAPPVRKVVAAQQFSAGDRVSHPSFGEGVVVSSRMTGDDEQVEVLFKGNVAKKLSMAFAPLTRLG